MIIHKIKGPVPIKCGLQHSLRLTTPDWYCFDNNYDYIHNKIADVYPCCLYSFDKNTKPLGSITVDDIKQNNVFNKLNLLYNNLKYNHVLPGCKTNKSNIYNNDYICNWNDNKLERIIVSMQKSCNLKCKMCRNDYMIFKDYDNYSFEILEQLKGHNLLNIGLTDNGEPFLYKDKMFNFLKSLKKNNDVSYITCISNLTLLNDDDIEQLKEINNNIEICITASIDGITAETYEKIRRNKFFDKVMHNAFKLKEYGILKCINFVIQDDNIHELLEAYEYWKNVAGLNFCAIPINNNIDDILFNNIIKNDIYLKYLNIIKKNKLN